MSELRTLHGDEIIDEIRKLKVPAGIELQLPPPSMIEMQGELVEYTVKRALTTRFPVLDRYANPMGRMQGGFVAAAIDNTMGPLSFLIARAPVITLELHTNYVRGISAPDTLRVSAELVSRGRTNMLFRATAFNDNNKEIANATSYMQIVRI